MAQGRSIGTVFVELALDPSRYTKGQQQLYKDATTTSLNIEENFKKLGVRSSAEMDLMRAKITNAFNMIAASSKSTANDIMRAEEAKVRQLTALNEQQYGKQVGLLDSLKANWIAASAAIVAAWMAVGQAMQYVELGAKAQQSEESFRLVAASSGIMADNLLANMDRAAAGTVDDSDLMQSAVKGMVLGLNDNQLVTIMEAARLAARYAGTDVKTAFTDITNAIGTDMPRALKQYGLITREETKQIQEAISAGAKDVSLYSLAMAHAAVNSAKFGEAQRNAAEGVQIFKAVVNEAQEAIGKFLIGTTQYLTAGALGLDAFITRAASGVMALAGRTDDYLAMQDAAAGMVEKRNKILGESSDFEKKAAELADWRAKKNLAKAEADLKAEKDKIAAAVETAKTVKKLEEDREQATKQIVEATRKSTTDADNINQGAYALEMSRLESTAEKYRKLGVDRVLIEAYVASETAKIRRDEARRTNAEQAAIAKEGLQSQLSLLEYSAQASSALRQADASMRQADVGGTGGERVRRQQEMEPGLVMESLRAVEAATSARVSAVEQYRARQIASLQGMLAQGYTTEREYADQVRALDRDLYAAKQQSLQTYSAALMSALSKAVGDYQKFTDQVRALDATIRATQTATEDMLSEIRRASMNPEESLAERERRAQERWAEAARLTGDEQVKALQAVQAEYKALALEAGKAAKETAAVAEDAFNLSPSAWRSTQLGQPSEAYRRAWATQPGQIGSREWWALGFTGSTGQMGGKGGTSAETNAQMVARIGREIVAAQEAQRSAAEGSAIQAKLMASSIELAAIAAADLANALKNAEVPAYPMPGASEDKSKKERVQEKYEPKYEPSDFSPDLNYTPPGGTSWERAYDWGGDVMGGDVTPLNNYGGGDGMASGGFVPGDFGRPVQIKAHGGELVLNPNQQQAVAALMAKAGGSGGSDRPVRIAINLNGRTIAAEAVIGLKELLKSGEFTVSGN